MRVKQTVVYHEGYSFTPVLIEIVHPELQKHYKGKYLLQVLEEDGTVIYQRALQCK
jgi:hypothetical protein